MAIEQQPFEIPTRIINDRHLQLPFALEPIGANFSPEANKEARDALETADAVVILMNRNAIGDNVFSSDIPHLMQAAFDKIGRKNVPIIPVIPPHQEYLFAGVTNTNIQPLKMPYNEHPRIYNQKIFDNVIDKREPSKPINKILVLDFQDLIKGQGDTHKAPWLSKASTINQRTITIAKNLYPVSMYGYSYQTYGEKRHAALIEDMFNFSRHSLDHASHTLLNLPIGAEDVASKIAQRAKLDPNTTTIGVAIVSTDHVEKQIDLTTWKQTIQQMDKHLRQQYPTTKFQFAIIYDERSNVLGFTPKEVHQTFDNFQLSDAGKIKFLTGNLLELQVAAGHLLDFMVGPDTGITKGMVRVANARLKKAGTVFLPQYSPYWRSSDKEIPITLPFEKTLDINYIFDLIRRGQRDIIQLFTPDMIAAVMTQEIDKSLVAA